MKFAAITIAALALAGSASASLPQHPGQHVQHSTGVLIYASQHNQSAWTRRSIPEVATTVTVSFNGHAPSSSWSDSSTQLEFACAGYTDGTSGGAFLDTKHQRAAFIVIALGAALLWSLWDYGTGIIGIPVLAVLFAPLYAWLVKRRVPSGAAALVVTLLGLVLLVVPGMLIAGLLIGQAQEIAGTVLQSPIIGRFSTLQVQGIPIGPRIAEAGGRIVAAIGSSAFGLVGTATRLTLNLTIAFFGLYYVLKHPGDVWLDARPYIPFSKENTEKLVEAEGEKGIVKAVKPKRRHGDEDASEDKEARK